MMRHRPTSSQHAVAAWLVGKVVLLPIAPRQRPLLWLFEHSEGGSLVKRQYFLPEMRLRRLVYFRADPPNPRRPTLAGSPRALPDRQPLRRLCHLRDLCYAVTAVDRIVRPSEDDRFP